MTISPGNYDITIYQGATFTQQFTWKDQNGTAIDLTGYTARMMARTAVDNATPFISLATGGGIALGGAAGTITLTMSDAQTAALAAQYGVYDLELIDGSGNVSRLLQGNLFVHKEITR
jgi:hypothetical protein